MEKDFMMPETIITSEVPSSPSPLNPASRIVCRVCQKQFSQYTCPRCNTRYCSVQCYKSHSLRCTESFMRDNVVEELQQLQPADETKQKMLDILRRFHSQEETDDMDEDDSTLSEETIQKVLSGGEISFGDLSTEERSQFQRAMASGEISKLIEPWDPWWLRPSAATISLSDRGTQLVQPLIESKPENSQQHEFPPGPDTPLTPIHKLTSIEPSPFLAVHLIDIIYSYCFTLRVYNGEWISDPIGSVTVMLTISSVLGQNGQPETVPEALAYCLEQACSPAFRHMGGSQFGLGLMDDVVSLLSLGGSALICMLCDLQRMVQEAERELKLERKTKRSEIKSKLKGSERKIYFIMCWVHEQPDEAWGGLATIVKAEKASVLDYKGGEVGNMKKRGKTLIEEIH